MKRLKYFLYLIMRDHVVPGTIARFVYDAESYGDNADVFSNTDLAAYADKLAKRLQDAQKPTRPAKRRSRKPHARRSKAR